MDTVASCHLALSMKTLLTRCLALCALTGLVHAADPARKPTVFLIGDSTVKNGNSDLPGQGTMTKPDKARSAVQQDNILKGWGQYLAEFFDPKKVTIENHALGGTSSRSFLRDGLWERVLKQVQPGDFVIIQFGHNDGGPMDSGKARASIKGNGDESKEVIMKETGSKQVVRSYGWYLRKYATDTQAKGATAIICSQIPRNIWTNSKVGRADADYGKWAAEAAAGAKARFIALNTLIANKYDALGSEKVGADYFTAADHTHTNELGARFNAQCVVEGIRKLKDCPLVEWLK